MYKINACVDDVTLDANNICSKCDKKLVDLRNLDDDEVQELISSSNSSICAIATADKFHSKYYLHPFKRFAFAMILVFGSSVFVMGNDTEQSIIRLQQDVFGIAETTDKESSISGKITDELGSPIIGASINLYYRGKLIGSTSTNVDGEYRLLYPIGSYNRGLSITISADGFDGVNEVITTPVPRITKNVTLAKGDFKNMVIGEFIKVD